MSARAPSRRQGAADPRDAVRRRWVYDVRQRCAAVVRASGMRRPPFAPERYAAKCGVAAIIAGAPEGGQVRVEHRATDDGRAHRTMIVVDRRLPPHTPQWNGAVALGLGETMVPPGAAGEARRTFAEAAAADLLLPAAFFRPAAARTDLTMDGLRDLSARFAAPLRLTARQWLSVGLWRGFALLWRELDGALRLGWRASSSGRFPPALALGVDAAAVWAPESRLFATRRTGRAHHGVEEVRTGGGTAWWFTRFAAVRDGAGEGGGAARPAVFAMVMLASGRLQGIPSGPSK
jgi:hypothetical protein